MPFNLPIFLTWLRVAMIPLFVGIFYLPDPYLNSHEKNLGAAVIFALAAITDWFDGYIARKWGQTTAFGAFLDPVADKLMVAAALIMLVWLDRCGAWVALIIIGREITISALREWMAQLGAAKSVAVSYIGKVKTAAQMVSIVLLLYFDNLGPIPTLLIGRWLIFVAAVLTLWSMFYYLRVAAPQFRRKPEAE